MRTSIILLFSISMLMLVVLAPSVSAAPSININGYDYQGSYVFTDGSSPIPVGASVRVRVWVDLYSCDPVTVNWGDGSPTESKNYGGSFAREWEHVYTSEGTYTIVATEGTCPGTSSTSRKVTIGGIGFPLSPSSPFFVPTLLSVIMAVIGLALANAKINLPRTRPGGKPVTEPVPPQKPKLRGFTANMTRHMVRLQDVPPGAPMQYDPLNGPKIEMEFGKPTDINKQVKCRCGGQLGFTVEGWFCMSHQCPLIGQGSQGFPRNPPPP